MNIKSELSIKTKKLIYKDFIKFIDENANSNLIYNKDYYKEHYDTVLKKINKTIDNYKKTI
jgi:hypothetical protein